jgi:GNAT superfamily N-acetyltransferase
MAPRSNADLCLRRARVEELAALSELCLRSKAVWGYDTAFLESCRAELALTARDLDGSHVQVAEKVGSIVGIAQVSIMGAEASLDKLFIEPSVLRSGAGRRLFAWCAEVARENGARVLRIEADPGAAEFYRRMGAKDAGITPSGSIPGRMLPLLKLDL